LLNIERMRWMLLPLLLCACDSATDPDAGSLEIVAGADQLGGAGAVLPLPVVVRVLDNGQPVRGAEVKWFVAAGGGTVDSTTSHTDTNGNADVLWTLGTQTGQQSITASFGSTSVNIRATAEFQVASVSAGYRHTCALSSSGVPYCWGLNQAAQLGDGTEVTRTSPVPVFTVVRFQKVSAGYSHSCGIALSGEAFCWGENLAGQLGIGFRGSLRHAPVQLVIPDIFTDISAGYVHTCGVTTQRAIVCWGSNLQGQLSGTDTAQTRITGHQFDKVSAGEFHTCGLRTDGVILCWGLNSSGELGIGTAGDIVRTPTPVAGNVRFQSVAAGVRHTCAISIDSTVYCWGRNAFGETGRPPLLSVATPAQVDTRTGFTMVSTGNTHTCGISSNTVYCWGSNLGSGAAPTPFLTVVPALNNPVKLSAGFDHTCVVTGRNSTASSGDLWCWGSSGVIQSVAPVRVQFPAN
jgi:alpha-tubulin suppressor-like RCC1 family protein